MMAAMPVVDPSAAISKVVPGCCALNSSANCGTSFAPKVSDPLTMRVSPRAARTLAPRATINRTSFFILYLIRCDALSKWNKPDLGNDLLTGRTSRESEKLFGQPGRLAVRVIKRWPRVRVVLAEHALHRRRHAVDRHDLDSASFGVGESDITSAVWIFADLGGDLLVPRHFLRARRVIALLHRQFLKVGIGARRSVTSVNGNLST